MRLDAPNLRGLCRARELLEDTALPIADIARAAGISRFHFIRLFEAAFGATPQRYRTRARLERARGLLAHGASVTDACFDVGFSSVGSFSALFARTLGAPPSAYRRRWVSVPEAVRALYPGCLSLISQFPRSAWASR